MILPNNGKVVIIDDIFSEVKDLISALSKEKVSYLFYTSLDGSDLPTEPIDNVRLVFLDLEITDIPVSKKDITGPIKTRLQKIIFPNTPYVLIIWSKKQSKYLAALKNDFEDEFKNYKPIILLALPKKKLISSKNPIGVILEALTEKFKKFKSFNAFLVWESIVNESSGKLTNEILTLYPANTSWDKKTKFILYKLAIAYSGKAADSFDDIKQLKNALYTLTYTYTDSIENLIDKVITNKFSGLISKDSKKIANFTSMINKLLLISESNDDATQPGNLFFCINESETLLQKNEDSFVQSKTNIAKLRKDIQASAISSKEKIYNKTKQEITEIISRRKKEFNEITVSSLNNNVYKNDILKTEILESIIGIELNITPLCDYAQEKAKCYRILPGVLIKSKYRKHINVKSSYLYLSDADFRIIDNDYLFLFDFRYLHSTSKVLLKLRSAKYRIKQQLLSDIQVKLGSHINRSGVLYVS
jgi:hypothetical protein